jgi:hypothetical protein
MEKLSSEQAHVEAMAIKAVAQGRSKEEPSSKELDEADKKINTIKEYNPLFVELIGEAQLLKEKVGPELNKILVDTQEQIFSNLTMAAEHEIDLLTSDSSNFEEAQEKLLAGLKNKIIDKYYPEWIELIKNYPNFTSHEQTFNQLLPEMKNLFIRLVEEAIRFIKRTE